MRILRHPPNPPSSCLPFIYKQGCVASGQVDTALRVSDMMQSAGLAPNAFTHRQLVDAYVVAGPCHCSTWG